MKTVKVDRALWSRGSSSLLLNCRGKSCVQGWVYLAYGAEGEHLLDQGMHPRVMPRGLPPEWTSSAFRLVSFEEHGQIWLDFAATLPQLLARINDTQAGFLRSALQSLVDAKGVVADDLLPPERRQTYQRLLQVHDDPEQLREAWLIEELKPLGIELEFC